MALTGQEVFQVQGVDGLGRPSGSTETISIASVAGFVLTPSPLAYVVTALTNATGTVITAAMIAGGIVNRTGPVAAFTDTTDTAANIIALIGTSIPVGYSLGFFLRNNTAFNQTIAGGAGVTITATNNNNIVPPNSTAFYTVSPTSGTTVTLSQITQNPNSSVGTVGYAAAVNTASFTATAAQFAGSSDMTINLTGALAAGATITSPTVALAAAGIIGPAIGTGWPLRIINSSSGAFSWTLAGGTGFTTSGTMTIAQNTFRDFYVAITGATTGTITNVGTGLYS